MIMPVERSVGTVIYIREGGKIYYLLLHYPSISHRAKENYWDFPKGHIEKGEKAEDTAKREAEEETGLKGVEIAEGFEETINYFFKYQGKNILKFVTFYLAETKAKRVKISGEHIGFKWLPYEEALNQLKFKNAKEILQKANNFLSGKSI
jgi:8-oxo-dGTP pyrophosphatase MutT (NUDIX family)